MNDIKKGHLNLCFQCVTLACQELDKHTIYDKKPLLYYQKLRKKNAYGKNWTADFEYLNMYVAFNWFN